MESLSEVDLADFEHELTRGQVLPFQIVHAGFGATMIVLGVVAAILAGHEAFRTREATPGATMAVALASGLNFLAFFICQALGTRLFNAPFTPRRLSEAVTQELRDPIGRPIASPAGKCLAIMRKAILLRLVCLDAAAGFGFGACVVAIVTGVMRAHPACWLNGLPAAFLLLYVALTFPTAARLKVLFLVKIAGAYRVPWARKG